MTHLTEADTGKTISIIVGSRITIRLKETPTTGYRWHYTLHSTITAVDDRFLEPGAVGAEGLREITLSFSARGSYEVTLAKTREWDNKKPMEIFTSNIRVF